MGTLLLYNWTGKWSGGRTAGNAHLIKVDKTYDVHKFDEKVFQMLKKWNVSVNVQIFSRVLSSVAFGLPETLRMWEMAFPRSQRTYANRWSKQWRFYCFDSLSKQSDNKTINIIFHHFIQCFHIWGRPFSANVQELPAHFFSVAHISCFFICERAESFPAIGNSSRRHFRISWPRCKNDIFWKQTKEWS